MRNLIYNSPEVLNQTKKGKNKVTIAPSANKSFDINFCDENVLFNLLNKYNFLIFFNSARHPGALCHYKITANTPSKKVTEKNLTEERALGLI